MADIAQIGFRADTDELKEAKTDLNALVPAANKAERAAETFSGRMGNLAGTLSGKVSAGFTAAKGAMMGFAAGMLAAFSAGAIIAALNNISQSIDDISKAASKLKVNMGDLQGLGLAADLSGVAFSELATAAQRMNKVLGQAIATGKGTEGVFKILGVSAQELSAMPIDERFGAIADRMNAMNLTADQTALILSKLGDRNGSLTALFEGGSEAINEASNMLDRFNGKLTNEQGKQVEAMNDAFTALNYSIQAVGVQVVAFVAPFVGPVIQGVAETIGAISRSFAWVASSASTAAAVIRAVFGSIAGAFNPIGAAITALGRLFQSVFGTTITDAAKTSANFVINAFSGMYGYIKTILSGVPQLFSAAFYGGASMALKAINSFVQNAINAFNGLASAVGSAFGVQLGNAVNAADYDMAKSPMYQAIETRADNASKAAQGVFTDAKAAFEAQMGVDNFSSAVTASDDTTKKAVPGLSDFSGALDGAAKSAGAATEKLTELQSIGAELDKLAAPFDQAKSAYDKLQELQKNGIVVGDQYTSMLERIRAAFIATGGTAEQWSKVIASKTNDMTTALKDFSTNALTSVGDTLADLAVDGKADFKALADGIMKDLIRMGWQAVIVKPIIGGIFGFADGGVFAPAGAAVASAASSSGAAAPKMFANGGTFSNDNVAVKAEPKMFGDGGAFSPSGITAFANGGAFTNKVVNKPTAFQFATGGGFGLGVMGEAGSEAIMPLKRGRNGSLGVQAHGLGGGSSQVNSLSIGDVNIQMPQSSGDANQDRATAGMYADAFKERIEQIAAETFANTTRYGGSANPRGYR